MRVRILVIGGSCGVGRREEERRVSVWGGWGGVVGRGILSREIIGWIGVE